MAADRRHDEWSARACQRERNDMEDDGYSKDV